MAKNKFKFELNKDGVNELLRGQAMQELLGNKARTAATSCGAGYKADTFVGKNRANASIYADTNQAKKDNLKNNTILKSLQ